MKSLLQIAFLAIAGWYTRFVLPWWGLALVAAIGAFAFHQRQKRSFWLAFVTGALLWGIPAYQADAANDFVLAQKVGLLLGALSPKSLLLLTAATGGLLGGLGAWTGSAIRYLLRR